MCDNCKCGTAKVKESMYTILPYALLFFIILSVYLVSSGKGIQMPIVFSVLIILGVLFLVKYHPDESFTNLAIMATNSKGQVSSDLPKAGTFRAKEMGTTVYANASNVVRQPLRPIKPSSLFE